MDLITKKKQSVTQLIVKYGYPAEFGILIGNELGSELTLNRMISYLLQGKPSSMEEIADEMIAILEDRNRWRNKKIAESNNQKYNELLAKGLSEGEDEE